MMHSFISAMDSTTEVRHRVDKLEEANIQLNKTVEDIDKRTSIIEYEIRHFHNTCDELEETMNNSNAEMRHDIMRLRKQTKILTAILSGFAAIILIILAYICIGG